MLNLRYWLLPTLLLSFLVTPLMAEPIGVMERYALAPDREAMLGELIPGSEDYYFYHCLHFQTTGQLPRSETILDDWLKSRRGQSSALISAMTDRQRLLTYRQAPERTIDHLIRRLGVKLDHTPPIVKGERRFPSQFDAATLDVTRLVDEALKRSDPLKPLGMRNLAERFQKGQTAGLPISLQDFLKRVDGAYIEDLDQLVIKELLSRPARDVRFGDVAAHQFLTDSELDAVARRVPAIADDNAFVTAKLTCLRPSADQDLSQQPDVRLDYLKRVEKFVQTLPPSYNSLKASAAYRLLEANLSEGNFDLQLFLRYLQLPRTSPIVHPEWTRVSSLRAKLSDDYTKIALLPPIGDEQQLVRTYLEHFLNSASDTRQFDRYLRPEYLRRVFAETKLMAGVGNPGQWYKMLSAGEAQAIRDATQLTLAVQNKTRFAGDEPTRLLMDLKNVDELVVRIYEINTLAYYRTNNKRLDTDVDLDGLIATHQRTIKYDQPSIRRHSETIDLPEIAGRGVWVVDLVGKGLRARAMIRRGTLHHVDQTNANGMQMTVLNEQREVIPGAKLFIGAQSFSADDDGRITIPPVARAVTRVALLTDGEITTQVRFAHPQEEYELTAGMHIDRTLLQTGGDAEIIIRPRVRFQRQIIDPATLTDVTIRIEASDLEGIATSKEITDVELDQNSETIAPIRVSPRLALLTVTLSGELTGLADRRTKKLSTSQTWDIAGIRKTSHTLDAFLTRDGDDFVIDVRGRTGEIADGATVNVSLTTQSRQQSVEQTLQSDENGRIRLGTLPGVSQIRYGVTGAMTHQYDVQLHQVVWPQSVHLAAGSAFQLPVAESIDNPVGRYRLLELRDGRFFADRSDAMKIAEGLLTVDGLPAGDFQLIDRSNNQRTSLSVVDGQPFDNVVAGAIRHREVSPAKRFSIESAERGDENVTIRLGGQHAGVRVHLIAKRYFDSVSPIDALHLSMPTLSGRSVALPRCGYVSDLRLGDEYQYVLRRRYAKKYPGVMLPQPSVLLNPWETEETTNQSQSAREGAPPPPSAEPAAGAMMEANAASDLQREATGSSDFDFLADSGVTLMNLRADENGVITVPSKTFEDLPLIQVIAADPANLVMRTITSPTTETPVSDLRLAKSLPIDKALSFERAVSVVSPDQPLDLASLGSAQLQVYGNVASLMKLYQTLVSDDRFAEFEVLADWHNLSDEQKQQQYASLASHELHVFLKMHDETFFESVVEPYLANKKEKQFIDHWLLENDLTPWLDIWRYNDLNAAERALLAMRLPAAAQRVQRELAERVELLQQNHEVVRKQIESALRLKTLESLSVSGGVDRFAGAMVESEEMDMDIDGLFGDVSLQKQSSTREMLKRRALKTQRQSRGAYAAPAVASESMFGGRSMGRTNAGFYQDLDSTKQWAESHWDRVRTVGNSDPALLIDIDPFWADVANENLESPGVSSHLLRPVGNRHAALMALAMCGLPLQSGDIDLPRKPNTVFKPEHAVAVVSKRLKVLDPSDEGESILIGQRFQRLGAKTRRGEAPPEPAEFLTGVAYQGQTVVSNPTAVQRVVDIFWQIPAGSLPLAGSQVTDSRTITLQPYAVQSIEYQFYFPAVGEFVHYPATVAGEGLLLARGNEKTFSVVDQLSDPGVTWESIANQGTADEIRQFLATANLNEINWMAVAHRMKEADVYQVVIKTLSDANLPIENLWAYSLKHRDEPSIKKFLSLKEDLVKTTGPVLQSPLLDVDPIERRLHEHLEYSPLVRARIHRLGDENEILNPTFLRQYRRFVRTLGFRPETPESEKLVLTYYLLIQNRITEAIDSFSSIDRNLVESKLQYDYLAGYLAMHRGEYAVAETIANRHSKHPVPRWRQRFSEMQSHLQQRLDLGTTQQLVSTKGDEAKGVSADSGDLAVLDRERFQSDASDHQPEVIVRVEGESLRIDHRNTKEVTVNMYGVDLELLFSKAPFVRKDLQRIAMVRPMLTESIEMDGNMGVANYPMNENLRRQTLLVEVVSGASRSVALYYGGELTTYVSEGFGQLQTTDAVTHRPVSMAYVKVYARHADGSVRFHKDGYTDARGRFDYASVSAGDAKGAARYAILVMSDEKGATLHDVAAPGGS